MKQFRQEQSRTVHISSTSVKMMAKLFIFICAASFFSHVSARTWENPYFMDYNDKDDIIDDLKLLQPDMKRIPLRDENVKTVNNYKVISNANEVQCRPRPIPVPISVPNHVIITPRYVTLNRCMGPGFTSVEKCVVRKRERVLVKYTELASVMHDQANQHVKQTTEMYNDLECGSTCIITPEDCDSRTQTFAPEKCGCSCKLNTTYCESIDRYYDNSLCRCYCKKQTTCPVYQEWNPVTCQCECAQCIKQMCEKHNLIIDNDLCKCTAS